MIHLENAAKFIAEKTNYLNKDISYLRNTVITEYDIKSAGFTVIKAKKLLPSEEILELENIDKMERNIRIGKRIIQYPRISEEIINTLADVRKSFVLSNNIQEDDILAIKKDALFLIKSKPVNLIINEFEFRKKESYTSYILLNKKEFYYSSFTDTMDIKGLGEEVRNLQGKYLIADIKRFLGLGEKVTDAQMLTLLKSYRSKYLNRQLPVETYRDMDSGKFSMGDYQLDNISEDMLSSVDISQNYINYILPLIQNLI
jgi:hypothetical protein